MYGQFGNDTFVFAGLGLGSDRVVEAGNFDPLPNDPHDRLDFSSFGGAVDIELDEDEQQTVNSGSFEGDINLRVELFSGTAIEDVTGSAFNDDIEGNNRNNILIGGDGDDDIDGGSGIDDISFALTAAQSAGESVAMSTLTHGELEKIFQAAVTRWTGVGYIDQARLATLDDLDLYIADLAGLTLGQSSGNRIIIDANAAGNGWFVDETPGLNEEFVLSRNGWVAKPNSAAYGKMDLLTAVSHEIGHYLGLDHDDTSADLPVMNETLSSGHRYVGESSLLSSAFFAAGSAFLEEAFGLTDELEDEEDALEDIPVLIFDEASGTFSDSESEETGDGDGEWYIDNGDPEPDEDVYTLLDLDDEDFTQLAGLSLDDNNGHDGSTIDWNSRYAY